jgi:hypothetical protein
MDNGLPRRRGYCGLRLILMAVDFTGWIWKDNSVIELTAAMIHLRVSRS